MVEIADLDKQEESLKDMIKDLKEKMKAKEEIPKEDNWRMPWLDKFKSNVGKKKIEKGWATIQIIRSNGNITFTRAAVKDGIAIIDGFPRACTVDHVLYYKKKPFYIIPEWSLKPFSAAENYAKTEQDKMNIAGRRAILATLTTEKIKVKKDWGSMSYLLIIAIVVGAGWYFGKQYGWF